MSDEARPKRPVVSQSRVHIADAVANQLRVRIDGFGETGIPVEYRPSSEPGCPLSPNGAGPAPDPAGEPRRPIEEVETS